MEKKLSHVLMWLDEFDEMLSSYGKSLKSKNKTKQTLKEVILFCNEFPELLVEMDYTVDETSQMFKFFGNLTQDEILVLEYNLWEENKLNDETIIENELEPDFTITDAHLELFEEYDVKTPEEWKYLLLTVDNLTVDEWNDIDYLEDRVSTHAEEIWDEEAEEMQEDIDEIQQLIKNNNQEETFDMDKILDKISKSGMDSLTHLQKSFLDNNEDFQDVVNIKNNVFSPDWLKSSNSGMESLIGKFCRKTTDTEYLVNQYIYLITGTQKAWGYLNGDKSNPYEMIDALRGTAIGKDPHNFGKPLHLYEIEILDNMTLSEADSYNNEIERLWNEEN